MTRVNEVNIKKIPQLTEVLELPANADVPIYDPATGITGRIKAALLKGGEEIKTNWSSTTTYAIEAVVEFQLKLWKSLINNNIGNTPVEGSNWTEVSRSTGNGYGYYSAGVFTQDPSMVIRPGGLFLLDNTKVTFPFNSIDFEAELQAGIWVQLTFPPDELTGDEIVDLLEGITDPDKKLDASAIKNLPTEAAVGGFASNVYFSNTDSDIIGYKKQSSIVDTLETILTTTVQSSEGNKLVNQYLFDLPANVNLIQQGNWSFTFASFVSSATGDTRIGFRPFRYTALGVKTYTFTGIVWSDELNQLTREYKTANLIQESKAIELTDRLGCDLYIKTSSAASVTVNIVIGDGHALFMNVPIALRHSALRDLNGDSNYVHLTQAEKNIIPLNSSGFNGNLTPADNTLQKIADKFDDLYVPTIETIDVETLEPYDPLLLYDAGVYKSYVNLASSDQQFQSPAIYLSMFEVGVGQTPESHPYDPDTNVGLWWYLGSDPIEVTSRATSKTTLFSIAELQSITGAKSGDTCNVLMTNINCIYIYKYDENSTAASSSYGFSVVKPSTILEANPGRWLIQCTQPISTISKSYKTPYSSSAIYIYPNSLVNIIVANLAPDQKLNFTINSPTTNIPALFRSENSFVLIDNSANSVDLSIIFDNPILASIEWVGGTAFTSLKAGKKAYLQARWMYYDGSTYKLIVDAKLVNEEVSGGSDAYSDSKSIIGGLNGFKLRYDRPVILSSINVDATKITNILIGKNGATPSTYTLPYTIASGDVIEFILTNNEPTYTYLTLNGTYND